MIKQYDIQKISDLPIEQVADALGLNVARHWALCPYHNDSKPSLHFNEAKTSLDAMCVTTTAVLSTYACRWKDSTSGMP